MAEPLSIPPPKSSRSWLKGILFRLIPALLIFGLLEAGLRAFELPSWDACWLVKEDFWQPEPDPELGWIYVPGSYVAKATINEWGFRGATLPEEKPEGSFRILFIGDSTCFGVGLKLHKSFVDLTVQQLAAENPERTIEYVIGALPGYSSHHSRIVTKRMMRLRPDLVVFYVGAHNDHSRGRYYADGDIPARLARRHASWHQIHVLALGENIVDVLYRKFFRKLRSDTAKSRVPPDDFRANMREMVQTATAGGAEALVLLPPYSRTLLDDHETIPIYQEILEEIADDAGVAYLKLQAHFEPHDEEQLYLRDMFHFDELGHQLAADAIGQVISDRGWL